jgi:hypothetical protein
LVDTNVSAGYEPRPFGPTTFRHFGLSPLPSSTAVATREPEPVASPGDGDIVTGSIPNEPEPVLQPGRFPPSRETAELDVPLPIPRPDGAPNLLDELAIPRTPRVAKTEPPATAEPDNRSFMQKLFGNQRPAGESVASAPATQEEAPKGRSSLLSTLFGSPTRATSGTAVYDISARAVYLPSGEKLEAHSGLGDKKDDPSHVNVPMRGATPPHVYDLSEREQLFHGVAALRLTPAGGSGAIHGRVGLLAHSYMLGAGGDSNGCVSVKDYGRFLQAYRRGEIRRLVVVANAS